MNKEIVNARKQNMKIYSLYRTISLDLIFYYAIEFLFLTQVKGITPSQTVLSTSFYAIFMIILQIPASVIIDKLGTKKCTVFANVFNTLFIILIMTCGSMYQLIFAQFISALCFSLKDISDGALLNYSIPETKKKGDIFSRIEGKGFQNYFFVNSITAVISGFLYVINPYIPITLTLIFTIFSVILNTPFFSINADKDYRRLTLLKTMGLETRNINKNNMEEKLKNAFEINFENSNSKIKNEKEKSIEYLRKALEIGE